MCWDCGSENNLIDRLLQFNRCVSLVKIRHPEAYIKDTFTCQSHTKWLDICVRVQHIFVCGIHVTSCAGGKKNYFGLSFLIIQFCHYTYSFHFLFWTLPNSVMHFFKEQMFRSALLIQGEVVQTVSTVILPFLAWIHFSNQIELYLLLYQFLDNKC